MLVVTLCAIGLICNAEETLILEEGPADLPLERFDTDKPGYTVKLIGKAEYRLSPVVVDANCSGKGLKVEIEPAGNATPGCIQMEWDLPANTRDWSAYRQLMVWFHAPSGGTIDSRKDSYGLSVKVRMPDGQWYEQPASFVKTDMKDAWQTQRFNLRDGRWKRSADGSLATPDFKSIQALQLLLPLHKKLPLSFEIAGVGLYKSEPLAGSALGETHYSTRNGWLYDARLQDSPDTITFPRAPTDLVIDSFNSTEPKYKVVKPADAQCQFTTDDSQPPCGGASLKVELPVAAKPGQKPVTISWKEPTANAWQGAFEGLVLCFQAPKDSRLDMGKESGYLLTPFYRASLRVKDDKGEAWNYIDPVLQRNGSWQILRFPSTGLWRAATGWREIAGGIREVSIDFPAPEDYPISLKLAGIGLYKPHDGPKVCAEVLKTPDYGPTLTVLSTKDTSVKGGYYKLDDYDADKVKVDASGHPLLKDQTYSYRLTVDAFPDGKEGELVVEARDYWCQLKDRQAIRIEPGKDRQRIIGRELLLSGQEPGYLNMSATLNVEGREIYRVRWVMSARLSQKDGRLTYFWDKVRQKQQLRMGFIGGSITVQSPTSYSSVAGGLISEKVKSMGAELKCVIAGVPGTGSSWGVWRINEQLLDDGMDMLVCEFAVNDGGADNASAAKIGDTIVDTMEGIVRKTLTKNPKTAIVFIYVANMPILQCFQNGGIPHAIMAHHKVAVHYGIPEIHMVPVFDQGLRDEAVRAHNILSDGTHPSALGARCYGEVLAQSIFSALDWKTPVIPPPLPAPLGLAALDRKHFKKIEPSSSEGFKYVAVDNVWYPRDSWSSEQAGAKLTFPVKGAQVGLLIGRTCSFRYSGAGYPPTEVQNASGNYMLPKVKTPIDGELTIEPLPDAKGKALVQIRRWITEE